MQEFSENINDFIHKMQEFSENTNDFIYKIINIF